MPESFHGFCSLWPALEISRSATGCCPDQTKAVVKLVKVKIQTLKNIFFPDQSLPD